MQKNWQVWLHLPVSIFFLHFITSLFLPLLILLFQYFICRNIFVFCHFCQPLISIIYKSKLSFYFSIHVLLISTTAPFDNFARTSSIPSFSLMCSGIICVSFSSSTLSISISNTASKR